MQQFHSFIFSLFISLLDFYSKFFLKMLVSASYTVESKGKDCVLFFSLVSVSAGTREKGRNTLRGKSILPSAGLFLKRAILSLLKPWRKLCFICLQRFFPCLRTSSFVSVSCRVALGYTFKVASTPTDEFSRWMNERGDAGPGS